jgi:hypothetical protein
MEPAIAEQARILRQRGQAPKAIARALGVSASEIVELLNTDVPGLGAVSAAADTPRCWISAGWSHSLDLTRAPHWASFDEPIDAPLDDRALVSVFVCRDNPHSSKVLVAGFLLDVWCLGVKNAYLPESTSPTAATELRHVYFNAYEAHVPIPADLASHLVHGAADYAAGLGFEPHADFEESSRLLARPEGPNLIRFGRDGKPFYINGPYDDPGKVLRTLRRAVGDDGFGSAIAFPE